MKRLLIWLFLPFGLAVILTTASPVSVSSENERQWEDGDYAYDRARRAVERGEALPIAVLLERLKARVPGEVVGIEFEREYGSWVYEFKLISSQGHLLEVYVDALSGEIVSVEED